MVPHGHTVDIIIERLGGSEAAARLTGVGLEAVRKWRQASVIPSKHWPAIIAATGPSPLEDLPGERRLPAAAADVPAGATAALVLADGSVFWGRGFGAHSDRAEVGEICFNTGMTGYQETLTDPSYAGQIITFTFPHIGNVGTNPDDMEATNLAALRPGREAGRDRAVQLALRPAPGRLAARHGLPGLAGVDTRALTMRIRDGGAPTACSPTPRTAASTSPALQAQAAAWPGLEGMDLARDVSCTQTYELDRGHLVARAGAAHHAAPRHHVVAVDYGAKRNILRCLAAAGCRVTVVPATATAEDILRHQPDGVFLSNGPGDPAATGAYAVPAIQGVLDARVPVFGICLGHQLLALALGARTYKLDRGHRGANQPVKDLATGRVEITSQNHGFAVDDDSLPDGVRITHTSLFDGSNEGIACDARRAFSVQYHPEASPGPADSHHLFHGSWP